MNVNRNRLQAACDLALLVFLIAAAFWKLSFSRAYTWLELPDIANQVLPWLQVQALAIRQGMIALWDPYLLAGQPMVGQMQPGVTNPFTYLLLAMPMHDGYLTVTALHAWFVLLHVIAGIFAWLLCRSLALSRIAALFGGLFYSTAGYIGNTGWPSYLGGAIWLPLIALYAIRGNAPLTGMFLGLTWLCGHHQVPLFATLAGLALLATKPTRARLRFAAIALVISGLVASVQLLPALEYGRLTVRWVDLPDPVGLGGTVPYTVHQRNAIAPRDLFHLVWPGAQTISNPFAGFVALSLAALAVWRAFALPLTRYAAALATGALLFALADVTPLQGVIYALVPMADKARSPSVALCLVHLAILLLAVIGADLVAKRWRRAWILLPLLLLDQSRTLGRDYRRFDDQSKINVFPHLAETRDAAEFLKRQPGHYRAEIEYQELLFNFGAWHGVDTLSAYLPAVLVTNHKWTWWEPRALALFGVKYAVARKPMRPGQREIFHGAHGWNVYENPDPVRPRVWTDCGEASVTQYTLHTVRLRVHATCAGRVILADNYYPGWTAEVGGRPAEVEMAENALRAVAITPGDHDVAFHYRPRSLYIGLALTITGILVALYFGVRS